MSRRTISKLCQKTYSLLAAMILLVSVSLTGSDAAAEGKGIGFILYHALQRNQTSPNSRSLFHCGSSMKRADLYEVGIYAGRKSRISTKIGNSGECLVDEKIDQVLRRHPCMSEKLRSAYAKARDLDLETQSSYSEFARLGFLIGESPEVYFTSIMISSTDPSLDHIDLSVWNLAWLVDWVPVGKSLDYCPFQIEIRQGIKTPEGKTVFNVMLAE